MGKIVLVLASGGAGWLGPAAAVLGVAAGTAPERRAVKLATG
ncbi:MULTISPECIES: hypothetical protein [Actinomycetes]|nr:MULTISPECIES: hypothetical protein [Actinomycetes]